MKFKKISFAFGVSIKTLIRAFCDEVFHPSTAWSVRKTFIINTADGYKLFSARDFYSEFEIRNS